MAVDNVSVYVDLFDNELIVEYQPDTSVKMALPEEQDREIVSRLIQDPNFWTQFLQSISSALTINKG